MVISTPITIFGASGFVGSRIVARCKALGEPVRAVAREQWPDPADDLGDVIYAIGVTADFRTRPYETVEAHVGRVADLLKARRFRSFLYLSSTRIYRGAADTREETPLVMSPASPDRLYDLSKLLGECLCLSIDDPAIRVARLSNVFGTGNRSPTFLASILRDAVGSGRVLLGQSPESTKDYVHVDDVGDALVAIARGGRERIYNVAGGASIRHGEIAGWMRRALGARIDVKEGAALDIQPVIHLERLRNEFGWKPRSLMDELPALADDLRSSLG